MREKRKFVWQKALAYLDARADMQVVCEVISSPSTPCPENFSEVYRRLLKSLTNKQGMSGTIGSIEDLSAVFCEFDHLQTLRRYSSNWENLFETIQHKVQPASKMDKGNSRNPWVQFSKGSISGAEYLAKFGKLEEFLQYVNDFDEKPTTRQALPLLIGDKIFGYGFSLACDFLRRLGYPNYAKPDTHLKDIFSGLGLSSRSQLDVFEKVDLMAQEVGKTPYTVDKAFWLIGSGKLPDATFNTDKDKFVEKTAQEWQRLIRA